MSEEKEFALTQDINTDNLIRRTDNSLKEGDREAPQHARLLTKEEVLDHLAEIKEG